MLITNSAENGCDLFLALKNKDGSNDPNQPGPIDWTKLGKDDSLEIKAQDLLDFSEIFVVVVKKNETFVPTQKNQNY